MIGARHWKRAHLAGHSGPGSTHTPITLIHATVSPGATLSLPWRQDFNALAYVLAGRGTVGAEQRPIEAGQLAVFGAGDTVTVAADVSQGSNSQGESAPASHGTGATRYAP